MSTEQDRAYEELRKAEDRSGEIWTGPQYIREAAISLAYHIGKALVHAIIDVADAIRETRGDI